MDADEPSCDSLAPTSEDYGPYVAEQATAFRNGLNYAQQCYSGGTSSGALNCSRFEKPGLSP